MCDHNEGSIALPRRYKTKGTLSFFSIEYRLLALIYRCLRCLSSVVPLRTGCPPGALRGRRSYRRWEPSGGYPVPGQPLLVPRICTPYLLHSWNTVEEENGKDASGSAEGACEAAAV